jgi:hypothetical protein
MRRDQPAPRAALRRIRRPGAAAFRAAGCRGRRHIQATSGKDAVRGLPRGKNFPPQGRQGDQTGSVRFVSETVKGVDVSVPSELREPDRVGALAGGVRPREQDVQLVGANLNDMVERGRRGSRAPRAPARRLALRRAAAGDVQASPPGRQPRRLASSRALTSSAPWTPPRSLPLPSRTAARLFHFVQAPRR